MKENAVAIEEISVREYFAIPGSHFNNKDAAVIGPELDRIGDAAGLTASDVVAAARRKSSPLHGYFEWNDEYAAIQYREEQARRMVMSIAVRVVGTDGQEYSVRAFHSVQAGPREADNSGYRYYSIRVVAEDEKKSEAVLEEAFRGLMHWKHRYAALKGVLGAQYAPVFESIEQLELDKNA